MKKYFLILSFFVVFVSLSFIGSRPNSKEVTQIKSISAVNPHETISANFQNPHGKDLGIGPIKKVELGPINTKMADEGKTLFNNKCTVCHDLNQKKIGPPLQDITKKRTPEFIMNLLLNTVQMQQQDSIMKKLMKDYNNIPMPDPAVDKEQARSILEYLRSVAK